MLSTEIAAPPARLAACLADLTTLHRHICPRQVLGVRIGLYAGELLGVELPRDDKRLLVFVETDGCFADSVSVATGCWLGHRTMRLIDHGKSAATVVDRRTADAIRVWADPAARVRAAEYAPDAPDRWHAMRDGYRVMPVTELLRAARVTVDLDLEALVSRNGRRVVCDGCGEDVINDRGVARDGVTLCRDCAGTPYFRVISRL
ncbi:MAG: TraR/DksA C4-type zinc finger protein [Chloroflexi bacterium]|nr:TraR/DksA C4-type zinc finger protein [Chloroflexota bacterium]